MTNIHKQLRLNFENGLFIRKNKISESSHVVIQNLYQGDFTNYKFNFKVEYALKKLEPHSFFLFNNEPLLLFFEKDPQKHANLSRNIWNFNKSALVFINDTNELKIYNGFKYEKSGLLQVLETIKSLTDKNLKNYSYWKIVTADIWNTKDNDFKKKTRVDTKLLENIKTTRAVLIQESLSEKHVNRIIGRLIFVRYLIDRKVNFDYHGNAKELLTKDKLPELILQKDNLFNFFKYLLIKFKGDLLPLNGEQNAVKPLHLKILSNLFAGNDIKSHQQSLFNVFNFDFIPIELISNVYEIFLGEQSKQDKAFYTPPFLVDYILEQTVKPFIAKQDDAEHIFCKTVDFTCGSGIFLCETLRIIINRYVELAKPNKSLRKFREKIKQLLVENIFGNDLNLEAIEIAKFSLFITLLDYFENPKDIEDFEFPMITENFFNFDIFSSQLDQTFGKGKLIEPDFILGNPPWGKIKDEQFKTEIKISNKEFAQAFLVRLSDFSTQNTVCQVIVTSKLLYNLHANQFRNHFLKHYWIDEVIELSSIRHQIFLKAVGPAVILKYRYAFGMDTKDHLIEYVSLKPNPFFAVFKTVLIEKYDYKEIIQKELLENDWLWKVLVYGHILDFRFIKRLRDQNNFPVTLGSLLEDKDNQDQPLFAGTGVNIGNRAKSVRQYKNMSFIELKPKEPQRPSDLQRFYIHFDEKNIWKKDQAEAPREKRIFEDYPKVLIKTGFTKDYKVISAAAYQPCVFLKSIYAIISKNKDNKLIENITGLLNSDLIAFFILHNGYSLGIERERMIFGELSSIPIIENDAIAAQTNHLIKGKKSKDKETALNHLIFDLYALSETERDLIAYTQEITIPILQAKKKTYSKICAELSLAKPYKALVDLEITNYINIFKEHFSKFHNGGKNGYFNARIVKSKNILAIEFYIDAKQHKDEWMNEPDNEKALELVAIIGFQKVSSDLFIQKDAKILNRKSFSVLKINQYKYWHKAIARLDVIEFSEAMLQSQMRITNEK